MPWLEPDDDLRSDVAFERSLFGGKKEFDGSFIETIQGELFPDSNYLIGVRLRAEASSDDWRTFLYAESDFYDETASTGELPTEGYASYSQTDITWR